MDYPPTSIKDIFSSYKHYTVGDENTLVSGIAYSSKNVSAGDMFFCIVGENVDGHSYVEDAVKRGAVAIVCQRKVYAGDEGTVPMVIVDDTRKAMSAAASAFYGNPSQHMEVAGITGTNGKTTTTYLVQHILDACSKPCGLIGTTGIKAGDAFIESTRTTPESADLQRILADMRDEHECTSAVMEVSSHALSLDRVWGMDFAATAFTNLTQDHLDYHHTFEEYFEAKAKLFGPDYPAVRVINIGNEYGRALYDMCRDAGDEIITYSFFEDGDIHPQSVSYKTDRTQASMRILGKAYNVEYPLVGQFNLENVMCAIGVAVAMGCDVKEAVRVLREGVSVPGRLEHVGLDEGEEVEKMADLPSVYVDYAHTPDAVEKAASTVRALVKEPMKSKSIVVIGCGGDRDKAKRPLMGQAALSRADYAIITSDNPRTEDPDAIIEDIVVGIRRDYQGRYEVVPNRMEAIQRAVEISKYGDVVLLAGKGHEDYQIIGTEKVHFDDREAARAALEKKKERML